MRTLGHFEIGMKTERPSTRVDGSGGCNLPDNKRNAIKSGPIQNQNSTIEVVFALLGELSFALFKR